MKNNNIIIALVAGCLALVTPVLLAQNTGESGQSLSSQPGQSQAGQWNHSHSAQQGQYHSGQYSPANQQASNQSRFTDLKASSLIGRPVQSQSGERLGTVKDLVINVQRCAAPFAIVESGGAFGMGGKRIAVPLKDLSWSGQSRKLTLNASKAQFEAASTTPTAGWAAFEGQPWEKNIDGYYGQPFQPGMSRFEREQMSGMYQGHQTVRTPKSEQKGATQLEPEGNINRPGTMGTPYSTSSQELQTRINSLISTDQGVQQNNVHATVRNGVVTLSGQVPNQQQKQLIENQVKALPGVASVRDELSVQNQ